jgi:hypothetical protein
VPESTKERRWRPVLRIKKLGERISPVVAITKGQ